MMQRIIKIPGKSFEDLDAEEVALMIEADSSLSPNGNAYFSSRALDEFVHFSNIQRSDLKQLQDLICENIYIDVPGKSEKKINTDFLITLAERVREGDICIRQG